MREGIETDTLVAKEVMGWTYTAYGNGGGQWNLDGKLMAFGGYNGGSLPRWASDLADAMRLATKMVDLGHVFIIKGDGLRNGDHSPRWTVLCDNLPRVDSDSLPLAICQMALKAMKETKRGGYAGCQQE